MSKKDDVSSIGSRSVKKKSLNIEWPKIILSLILFVSIIGALVSTKILATINKNIAAAKEATRPANVKIIKIITPKCRDCFSVETVVNDFKKQNIKVEEEKNLFFDSPQALSYIKQLAIKKVPTYLVTGEITKENINNFVKTNGEIRNNTFIFTKLSPIFIDTKTKQEMGRVTATVITDPSCLQCADPKTIIENFKKAGVKVKEMGEATWNSYDGQAMINQHKISKVPTFIFSPEFDLYDAAKSNWQNIGTVEDDKTYIARNISLPYRDLNTGQIVGFVDIIYITDSSCTDCYNVSDVQRPILTNGYRVFFRSERTIDVLSKEGQGLISKYKITKVPTIILSPESDIYVTLKNVWKNVGTVEPDGWYVFRQMQLLRGVVYRDLATNQIIGGSQTSPTPSVSRQQ